MIQNLIKLHIFLIITQINYFYMSCLLQSVNGDT